jgi:hypothetical protein
MAMAMLFHTHAHTHTHARRSKALELSAFQICLRANPSAATIVEKSTGKGNTVPHNTFGN